METPENYQYGSGEFNLTNDEYSYLMRQKGIMNLQIGGLDNVQGLYDQFAAVTTELDSVQGYNNQGELVTLYDKNDFDLKGKVGDYAKELTDKFLEQTFLEPIMRNIINDAKDFQKKIKEKNDN